MIDLSQAEFRTASYSGSGTGGGCVAVANNLPAVTAIRDSTRPLAGLMIVRKDAFTALLDDVKAGLLGHLTDQL